MKALSLFFVPPTNTFPPVFSICQSSVPWRLAPVFLRVFPTAREQGCSCGRYLNCYFVKEQQPPSAGGCAEPINPSQSPDGDPGGAPRPRQRNLPSVLEAPIIPGELEIQQCRATSTHTTHIWLTSPTPNEAAT